MRPGCKRAVVVVVVVVVMVVVVAAVAKTKIERSKRLGTARPRSGTRAGALGLPTELFC